MLEELEGLVHRLEDRFLELVRRAEADISTVQRAVKRFKREQQ